MSCDFHCTQQLELLVLLIPTCVNSSSCMNRLSRSICSHSYNHSQSRMWPLWCPSKIFYILWRWYTLKLSSCRIIHTCVTAIPVLMVILHTLACTLHCTATRESSFPSHVPIHGIHLCEKQSSLTNLYIFKCPRLGRVLHQCWWRLMSSGIWRFVDWQIDISEELAVPSSGFKLVKMSACTRKKGCSLYKQK